MNGSRAASRPAVLLLAIWCSGSACASRAADTRYDVVIAGGTVYDGSGAPGARADVGIIGDEIKAVGDLRNASADRMVRADGLAVAPGFVNMDDRHARKMQRGDQRFQVMVAVDNVRRETDLIKIRHDGNGRSAKVVRHRAGHQAERDWMMAPQHERAADVANP